MFECGFNLLIVGYLEYCMLRASCILHEILLAVGRIVLLIRGLDGNTYVSIPEVLTISRLLIVICSFD
jgi:hypothetical protein